MIVSMNVDSENLDKYKGIFSIGGDIQIAIDKKILKDIEPYLPFRHGQLTRSGPLSTKIGSGNIVWDTPYARYMWHGKTKDGKDLVYDKSIHPLAGKRWTERYKADHIENLRMMIVSEVNKV